MTKATSSKKKKHEGEVVEQEKASSKPKKRIGIEIDEIFAKRKKQKVGSEIDEILDGKKGREVEKRKKGGGEKQGKGHSKSLEKRKMGMSSNGRDSSTNRRRKKTADGLTIYTEEELGVGKPGGGGTALCPFDCDCCF